MVSLRIDNVHVGCWYPDAMTVMNYEVTHWIGFNLIY